jgi:hypothetical protein
MKVSARNNAARIRIPRGVKKILTASWLRGCSARQLRDLARWRRKVTTCDVFRSGGECGPECSC